MNDDERAAEVRALNAGACPVVEAMDIVGESWRLLVVFDLRESRKRFNELNRSTGARSRTLSDALEALTEAGLVAGEQEPADPVAVYYSLTPKGEALQPIIDDLGAWAEEWDDPTVPEPIRQGAPADDRARDVPFCRIPEPGIAMPEDFRPPRNLMHRTASHCTWRTSPRA